MKYMKRIASVVLAMVMVLAMSMPVMAAPTSKEADLTGHTYTAYQIFSGTQTKDDDNAALASIEWGSGVNGASLLKAIKDDANHKFGGLFDECESARDVAEAIDEAGWNDDSEGAKAFAQYAYDNKTSEGVGVEDGSTTLNAGYYLIVDTTTDSGTADFVKNLALLQLTKKGEITIRNKTDVPEVEKKVKETNDTTGKTTDWQDAADYDIGDEIEYQITGTLPSKYSDYDKYQYTFHDTLSTGLDYQFNTKVTLVNEGVESDVSGYFNTTYDKATGELTVACEDLKKIPNVTENSQIIVTYTAKLTEAAVIGPDGNSNTVQLEYSNNPNNGGEGTTHTPDDKVTVFTYKLDVNKVGEDGTTPLNGAGFTLSKKQPNGSYVPVGDEITGVTTFEFKGLDAGEYKLEETTVPPGYNKADDIEITVAAEYDTTSDDPKLTSLTVTPPEANFTAEPTNGTITGTVKNQRGSTLPETGGIGTTIFYVVGAALVIGAGVLLVVKKRMSKEQ